jgi:hypothetical protein|tara:strand:+ start:2397 stop:2645 length:249 start_codon:yes stop_codon:yes gene_type:complete
MKQKYYIVDYTTWTMIKELRVDSLLTERCRDALSFEARNEDEAWDRFVSHAKLQGFCIDGLDITELGAVTEEQYKHLQGVEL